MNALLESPMDDAVFTTNLVVMGLIAQGVLDQYKNEVQSPERTAVLESELATYASQYVIPAEA
jgi:hypothetical protein